MNFLYTTFKEYCKKKNILVMHDDFKFIQGRIRFLSQNEQKLVMRDYTEKWLSILKSESKSSPNQNLARFECNMWLLDEIKKRRNINEFGIKEYKIQNIALHVAKEYEEELDLI